MATGSPNRRMNYAVTLKCGHIGEFPVSCPKRGDQVFCWLCDDYSIVIIVSDMYMVKCDEWRCRYYRRPGNSYVKALGYAEHHANTNAHVVFIKKNGAVIQTVFPGNRKPDNSTETVKEHQASLRNYLKTHSSNTHR